MLSSLILLSAILASSLAQIFRLPDQTACQNSNYPHLSGLSCWGSNISISFSGVVHKSRFNKNYHFSWVAVGRNTKWDWEGARNYCRKFCMDSITIETPVSAETA